MEYHLTEEYIELFRLLKLLRLAASGGQAKMMIDEGMVVRNGEAEVKRRAKIRKDEVLVVNGTTIYIK